jgi:hypothetical protein
MSMKPVCSILLAVLLCWPSLAQTADKAPLKESKGEQDSVEVPVKFEIEPYFELLLESRACSVEQDEKGNPLREKFLEDGGLYFGEIPSLDQLQGFRASRSEISETKDYGSTFYTATRVYVVNNVKPFRLSVQYYLQDETLNNMMELGDEGNSKKKKVRGLAVKTRALPETLHANNLVAPGGWRSLKGGLVLYKSRGEIVSDRFEVEFALLNLPPVLPAGDYGGVILWVFQE